MKDWLKICAYLLGATLALLIAGLFFRWNFTEVSVLAGFAALGLATRAGRGIERRWYETTYDMEA